jgi:predicted RNA-binding protein with TRAM domain
MVFTMEDPTWSLKLGDFYQVTMQAGSASGSGDARVFSPQMIVSGISSHSAEFQDFVVAVGHQRWLLLAFRRGAGSLRFDLSGVGEPQG